jgi:hypothetical protein
MADPDLAFISRQIERVLNEQRSMREQLSVLSTIREEQNLMRGEIQLLREQIRVMHSQLARMNDTITMDVMERLSRLEQAK